MDDIIFFLLSGAAPIELGGASIVCALGTVAQIMPPLIYYARDNKRVKSTYDMGEGGSGCHDRHVTLIKHLTELQD